MKKMKLFSGLMTVTILVMFLIFSCSREDSGKISGDELTLAQDEAYADALFEEVDNMVVSSITALDASHFSVAGFKSTGTGSECLVVTVNHPDSISFPKVITLDFGEGCTEVFRDDTIVSKGRIIITLTDRWFIEGAQHIITFNNFSINGVGIEGTRTITNLGLNAKNHLELGIALENGKIVFNDSVAITRNSNHVREWIRHFYPLNDTILITGSASGINIKGEEYQRLITEPLVLVRCHEYNWRWVISDGKVEITNSVSGVTTIDYGSTGCDETLVISSHGNHFNFPFRFIHHNHGS